MTERIAPTGWDTLDSRRSVLAVGRNLAATTRVLDIATLLADDDRVEVCATVAPGSEFGEPVAELLRAKGFRQLPWSKALGSAFDLAVCGSANGDLHRLDAPVMLFPHGAGHHKRLPTASRGGGDDGGGGSGMADLSPEQLLHDGRVVAARIMLPGEDSLRRLRTDCPQALSRARLAGDPVAQQLREHRGLRWRYRAALGLRPGQRLVVVSSTWGRASLAGRHLDLVDRLLGELPVDEYRVAVILHPNVSSRHGDYNVRNRLSKAIKSGLLWIPPHGDWKPTLIAADCVLGDHGSTTFYAADLTPVAIVTHALGEYPVDGPTAALIRAAPRLDVACPLLPQIVDLVNRPRPDELTAIVASSFAPDVNAATVFRSTMYELLRLPEPATTAFLPLREPAAEPAAVTALVTHATVAADVVTLTRHPAVVATPREGGHLVVRAGEEDPRLWQSAAVLLADRTGPSPDELLRRYPGAGLAARPLAGDGARLRLRDGRELLATVDEPADVDVTELAASACYALARLSDGRLPGHVIIHCGDTVARVDVREAPDH